MRISIEQQKRRINDLLIRAASVMGANTMEERSQDISTDHHKIKASDLNKEITFSHEKTMKTDPESFKEPTTSDFGAFLHILKSSLGTGLLAMPYAYKNAGLFMGLFGCIVTGIIVTHTTAILIECSQRMCRIFSKRSLTYTHTAEYAFLYGFNGRLKKHAYKMGRMVDFFLFITYYGVIIAYVLLVAETSKQVIEEHCESKLDIRFYTAAILILVYPIGVVRLMKYLVPFSALSNTCLAFAMCLIFREFFRDVPPISSRPAVQSVNKWPMFLSTVFLSMEGVGTILPIENEMKNPRHLTHRPYLMYLGMVVVVLLNTVVGFFGYLKYGDEAKGAISLNLPDDWLSQIIKLAVAVMVLFTYGLQLTVSVQVVRTIVSSWYETSSTNFEKTTHDFRIRSICIIGSVAAATALPSLAGVIGLIGSIGFSILGIFLPAVIEIVSYSENPGYLHWRYIKNISLMLFSVLCCIVGSYCSIAEVFDSET